MGGPPCAPRLLSDTARLQDALCRAPRPPVSVLAAPQLPGALDCSPSCSVCRSRPAEGSVVCAVHGGRGLVAAVLQNQFVIVT